MYYTIIAIGVLIILSWGVYAVAGVSHDVSELNGVCKSDGTNCAVIDWANLAGIPSDFSDGIDNVGDALPSWMIAFFPGDCPNGWTEYTTLQGRYVVGLPNGGTSEGSVGTALTNNENRAGWSA